MSFCLSTIFLYSILPQLVFSQAPDIAWQKCYGGSGSDAAKCIKPTPDGGYIVSGTAEIYDGDFAGNRFSGYMVLKIAGDGAIQWQKSYGGNHGADGREIIPTLDGGYIMVGSTDSKDGDVSGHHGSTEHADVWVVKMSSTGAIQWQKNYGGSREDYGISIQQTQDGGYIVAGSTSSNDGDVKGYHAQIDWTADYLILKLSPTGAIEWQKCFGGSYDDRAFAIKQTPDGGYIVNGAAQSSDGDVNGADHFNYNYDYWVLKLSAAGELQWQRSLGGFYDDWGQDVQVTRDGGYILGGRSASNDGEVSGNHVGLFANFDFWLVKLDSSGNLQWQKCFGGTNFEDTWSVIPTSDGGYAVAGSTESYDGDLAARQQSIKPDMWVVKLNSSGTIGWQKVMGSSDFDGAYSMAESKDEGLIIAGYASANDGEVSGFKGGYGDVWVVKLKPTPCTPTITITASADTICKGSPVTFTTTVTSEGGNPVYQWLINGLTTGDNTASFTTNLLNTDDKIVCILNSNARCAAVAPVESLPVSVTVLPPIKPAISITVSANNVCPGTEVAFTAMVNGAGTAPQYQWLVNGAVVNGTAPVFRSSGLKEGDIVHCRLLAETTQRCLTTAEVLSNKIIMHFIQTVKPVISLTASADAICQGETITFLADIENMGTGSLFQWQVNDSHVGSNSPHLSTNTLKNGDKITCRYEAMYAGCSSLPANSDTISIQVFALPLLEIRPADTTITAGSNVQLRTFVNGTVGLFQWQPKDKLQAPLSLSPLTKPLDQSETFHLELTSLEGCKARASVSITVLTPFYMPNAFTPNGDGYNDVFRIPPQVDLTLQEFSIYNRWGERVFFSSKRTAGWNGIYKGTVVETGVYVYVIRAATPKGNLVQKGTVTLIR